MTNHKSRLKDFMYITKALSDENRVRTLMILHGRELCACQIIELLQLSPSTVSKHLSILERAGLVERRKDGRWHWFRWPKDQEDLVQNAIDWVSCCLVKDESISEDAKQIDKILKVPPEELCCRQNSC